MIFDKIYHANWRKTHSNSVKTSQSKHSKSTKRLAYNAKYRDEHKDEISARSKKYYREHKETHTAKVKANNEKLKQDFVEMYGGRCVCCGEVQLGFLTIEHVKGQKGIHKKETSRTAYRKALEEYRPDLYAVLCWNCNCATKNGSICPHKESL